MSTRIKGITVEIGGNTTGLNKALAGVNKEIGSTKKQLKDVERLLKLDPSNTELLRQKYELLNDEVSMTEDKLEALVNAEKEVQMQFERGDISKEQYNALQREIVATEISLRQLKEEAEKAEKAVKGIEEQPIEEVAAAADEAEKQLEQAGKEASNFGDYLKAEVIVEGAKSIVSGLKDVAEESKDYMKVMGSLEVSSKRAGYTTEQTAATYKKLYGVLADEQAAATTTANLQALGLAQEDLEELTNAAIGAWATYGDSIPIDGLAEAVNETVKVGQVTGSFADVLNWAGTSEDEFNEKLAACASEAERADLILQELANQGLTTAGEAWRENNQALVENNEANAAMQEQMAVLGETIMPVMTQITEIVAGLLEKFNSLDESQQKTILTVVALVAVLGPVISVIGSVTTGVAGLSGTFGILTGTVLPALGTAFSTVFGFIAANPVVLLIAAIVGLVALVATKGDEIKAILQKADDFMQNIFAKDWTEVFGPVLGGAINNFFSGFKIVWDTVKKVMDGVIDFIQGVFSGDWEKALNGILSIVDGVLGGIEKAFSACIEFAKNVVSTGIEKIKGFFNFSWSLPHLKLPHPYISGSFSLNPPSVPSFGISWYAKAMNDPIIMNSPTAFGMNSLGEIMAGGEAGSEIVSGTATLMRMIAAATASQNDAVVDAVNNLGYMLSEYFPQFANMQMVMDTGAVVGAIVAPMDEALGMQAQLEEKGV